MTAGVVMIVIGSLSLEHADTYQHDAEIYLVSIGSILVVASCLCCCFRERRAVSENELKHSQEDAGSNMDNIEAPTQHGSRPPALILPAPECFCISAQPDWYEQGLDTASKLQEEGLLTPSEHRAEVEVLEAELERQRTARGRPATARYTV